MHSSYSQKFEKSAVEGNHQFKECESKILKPTWDFLIFRDVTLHYCAGKLWIYRYCTVFKFITVGCKFGQCYVVSGKPIDNHFLVLKVSQNFGKYAESRGHNHLPSIPKHCKWILFSERNNVRDRTFVCSSDNPIRFGSIPHWILRRTVELNAKL